MLDQANRTFIGSVVFVDVIDYSKRSVSEQILIKDRFTSLLSESLKNIDPEQRIILDTGDGAAVSFLGAPEDALFVAVEMRNYVKRFRAGDPTLSATQPLTPLKTDEQGIALPQVPVADDFELRIGINLGPVKLIRDINSQPNIVGDGINVAQRIMSFAQSGQIVASRSFYEVVSAASEQYAQLFSYEGSRTDKHVREHEIYVVGDADNMMERIKAGQNERIAATNSHTNSRRDQAAGESRARTSAASQTEGVSATSFLKNGKKLAITGAALGVVVLGLIAALAMKRPKSVSIAKTDTSTSVGIPSTTSPAPDNQAPTNTESVTAIPATTPPEINKPTKPVELPRPITTGTVSFNISPWGNVFVNDKAIGPSPPLKLTKLAPGKYKIEVRNESFPPYTLQVEVKADQETNIRHKF
jgi:hypothetical protein